MARLSEKIVLYSIQETEPKLSPSWNPKIICEPHPQFPEPVSSSMPFEPVQIGCLSGRLELSVVLKQNEAMPGAKVGKSELLQTYRLFLLASYKSIEQIGNSVNSNTLPIFLLHSWTSMDSLNL